MDIKVSKFGGTSLCDATQIVRVRQIVQSDPSRRYVVPSAPGKRYPDDHKITDLLYLCHQHAQERLPFDDVFALVGERFETIVHEVGLSLDLHEPLVETKQRIAAEARAGREADYAASRGEYLNGLILAEALGYAFVDATEVIFFRGHERSGRLDEDRTYREVARKLGDVERAVVPGFYGRVSRGQRAGTDDVATDTATDAPSAKDDMLQPRIKTFGRGGSDVSGAIIARGVGASLYENWTDVAGLLMADPRIVCDPRTIDIITYQELRELAYMGATVLHDEAVFPVRQAGIPVNIRNTQSPDDPGTLIVAPGSPRLTTPAAEVTPRAAPTITGIAGRKDFTVIALEKAMMNSEIGFGRRVLSVLEGHGVSFEHLPSSIDTMSLVIRDLHLDGKLDYVLDDLRQECHPDAIDVLPNMAVIATVGRGMARIPGMASRLFSALAQAQINIRMIDQGSSELNIIVGVEADDFEAAVRAIYAAFVDPE